jgi:hypothetical protein
MNAIAKTTGTATVLIMLIMNCPAVCTLVIACAKARSGIANVTAEMARLFFSKVFIGCDYKVSVMLLLRIASSC